MKTSDARDVPVRQAKQPARLTHKEIWREAWNTATRDTATARAAAKFLAELEKKYLGKK